VRHQRNLKQSLSVMELFDVGLWGMCMALCVWVGAAMAVAAVYVEHKTGGVDEVWKAPGRHEFFI
jgi:hypothetical protein